MSEVRNTSGIRPYCASILIKVDKLPDKTKSGVFIPENSEQRKREQHACARSTIIELGKDVLLDEDLFPGQRILTVSYPGVYEQGIDGEDYRLIEATHIVGIIMKEKEV